MKKILISVLLSASIFGLAACGSSDGDVIAKTNAGDITKEEYYTELKKSDPEGDLLRNLIIVKVLEDNYEVTEDEIDAKIEELKEEQGDNFDMLLMQIGVEDVEDESFRQQIKNVVLNDKVQFEGIEVTDEELEEQYQELVDNNAIEIQASHILVEDEDEAKDLKKQLDDGADFAELAEEHSIDEGSAVNGGDIGYFTAQDNLVQEFKDAAFELEVDEVSEPVESEFGYHIIKVTDIPTFEDKKEMVRMAALQSKVDPQEIQEKINDFLKEADIEIEIEEFENLFTFEEPEETNENTEDNTENNTNEPAEDDAANNSEENETNENK